MLRGSARLLAYLLIFYLAACSTPADVGPIDENKSDDPPVVSPLAMESMAYHPWWMQHAWTTYDWSLIDVVFFFDLPVSHAGTLEDRRGWPHAWVDMISAAQSADTPIHMTVSILEADVFRSVFSTPAFIHSLEESLMDLAASGSLSGLHLDVELFEPVTAQQREAFTAFVQRLGDRLRASRPGFQVSIFLTAGDPADAYDEATLASAVDFVVVQAYDLHWLTGDTAGPVAPLSGWGNRNWQSILQRMDAEGVPRSKMLFSIPYYGYEWPTETGQIGSRTRGSGRLTTYAPTLAGIPSARDQAVRNGLERDTASGSPWYAVEDSTGWTQGWFEDATSLSLKYTFVQQEGLRGVAIFPYAYGDEILEAALRDARMTPAL